MPTVVGRNFENFLSTTGNYIQDCTYKAHDIIRDTLFLRRPSIYSPIFAYPFLHGLLAGYFILDILAYLTSLGSLWNNASPVRLAFPRLALLYYYEITTFLESRNMLI